MAGGKTYWRVGLWLTTLCMIWPLPAHAEWSATLPIFKACKPATPPELPMRWRAVGLMMPFAQGQLDVGEFEYDGELQSMRATVYGVESGAVDLLITKNDTYLLDGPHGAPKHCTSLGPKLRVPTAQWLSSQSVCVGESPLATQPVQWWQTPGFDPARYWFSADTRLPWRTLFLSRALDPAIIGDYAMTYFPTFTPLPKTGLAALQDFCATAAKNSEADRLGATPTARELMTMRNKSAETEREERVGALIPGLSHKACAQMSPAKWPDRFIMTAVVTPISLNDAPYPTLIYYDWSGARTLLVMPFHEYPPSLQGILSLKNRVGYRLKISHSTVKPSACKPDLPGIVRPDWMKAASCQCMGVIKRNAALSPDSETQILSCPIKNQSPRIMWSWYTTKGQPLVFMEAAPKSGGVMLADYRDWVPGQTGQARDFELPQACQVPPNPGEASAAKAVSFSDVSCSDCHSTRW
jgi:hypothetical protein